MKVIPWILVLLLAGSSYYLFSKVQDQQKQITALTEKMEELENNRPEETSSSAGLDPAEIERLRNDAEDVYKLRGEITRLRQENKQLSLQAQKNQQTVQYVHPDPLFDDFPAENLTPQQQEELRIQLQNAEACVNHLKVMEEAKTKWATANNKSGGQPATYNDVYQYLPGQSMPLCPSGGTYTFNEVGIPASCSVEGHSLLP